MTAAPAASAAPEATALAAPVPRLRRALAHRSLVAGLVIVGAVVLAALCAPLIAPHDPAAQDLRAALLPPSGEHLLGTDHLGRDVFSRLVYAARTDLRIGAVTVVIPFLVGTLVGSVAGYAGGRLDRGMSYLVDTVLAFPFYVLILAIVAVVGTGERGIYVAYALVGWVAYARVTRSATSVAAAQPWVHAARESGLSHRRVLLRHVLPNTLPQAVVFLFTDVVFVIAAVVTLSYLGLGIQPPTADWGSMIADGRAFLTTKWWLATAPGLAVVVTGVGLSLVADGLTDLWGER
ncbi:ABC transporter permease [Streptomyces sp. PT12]|uniref:ABC transporter permease n=1 Tax=Streptomyces sp. PT12 TaxID=1510197 RepID=UPI001C66F425|nr:ABC transporter permease [Streptomyces sp. PT12]